MSINTSECTLTINDFIEAQQLSIRRSNSFWYNWIMAIFLCGLSFIEIKRINEPYFLVSEFTKNNVRTQTIEEHVIAFLFTFGVSIFIISRNFPQYNLISRWNISRKYQKDFIKQETKTIEIDETGIARKSDSYRESIEWSGYTKFAEGKNIFLLFEGKESNIIPKRIFNNTEQLNSFRELLNSKIEQK